MVEEVVVELVEEVVRPELAEVEVAVDRKLILANC